LKTGTTGFDEKRLDCITDQLVARYVEPGKIAACQVLVARHGCVAYHRSFGLADLERSIPVKEDTVWRIYSMTRPVTSVALVTLYEQARFQLSDPIHRFLPEWRDQKVCIVEQDGGDRLVPVERSITVRDLLTHTSGLTYGFDPENPVDRLYAEAGVGGRERTLEEFSRRLAGLPLKFQPGAHWDYSLIWDPTRARASRSGEYVRGRRRARYLRSCRHE
jgi:CubicO group peptidase (beta-lactamase class C family)